jgi:hypothetical protein
MTTSSLERAAGNGNAGVSASPPKEHRRWGTDGKRDPIGRIVGRVLGLTPISAEHLVRSVNHRTAAIIHAFKQLGDEERLARFLEPIDRARDGREPPPNCEATWMLAEQADATEDVDELRYQLEKSDANLAKLIKTKREMIRRETALLDTLLEEARQRGAR